VEFGLLEERLLLLVGFGLENTTINIIIAEQQQHAERSRGQWMILRASSTDRENEAPFILLDGTCANPTWTALH